MQRGEEWREVTVILEMTVTCGRGRWMEGRGWADGEWVGRGGWQCWQTRPYRARGMVGAGLEGWQEGRAGWGAGWQMTPADSGDPPSTLGTMTASMGKPFHTDERR